MHTGACPPPNLLPPLPDWKVELQQRLESYRQRHSHSQTVSTPVPYAEVVPEALPDGVLVFPSKSSSNEILKTTASAQATPEPIPLPSPPDPVVPPETDSLDYATQDDVPWERIRPHATPPAPAAAARPAPRPRPAEPNLPLIRRGSRQGAPALLQIPLPLATGAENAQSEPALPVAAPDIRLLAGMFDASLILLAALVFMGSAWSTLVWLSPSASAAAAGLPPLKHLAPALLAVTAVLGAMYFALSSFITGTTWGMRRVGLALAGIDGVVTRGQQRRRALASIVSLAAFGLGFLWIYCDAQQLAWHDSMSGTFPVESNRSARNPRSAPRPTRGASPPSATAARGSVPSRAAAAAPSARPGAATGSPNRG